MYLALIVEHGLHLISCYNDFTTSTIMYLALIIEHEMR